MIFSVSNDGRELLVAVSFGLAASVAVAERRSPYQIKRWEAYAELFKKVLIAVIILISLLNSELWQKYFHLFVFLNRVHLYQNQFTVAEKLENT